MVEDVGLDVFVVDPTRVAGKTVDLDGKTILRGGQLAHQQGHVLADPGVMLQIRQDIGTKGTHVRQVAGVDAVTILDLSLSVPGDDLVLFLLDVLGDVCDLGEALEHRRSAQLDRLHIDVNRSFDPTATRLGHAAPVLEGIRDQRIGRNRGDRLVPVLDLDGGQCNVDDITVRPVAGHFNPVPFGEHLVGGELDSRHKTQDGILENQHEH